MAHSTLAICCKQNPSPLAGCTGHNLKAAFSNGGEWLSNLGIQCNFWLSLSDLATRSRPNELLWLRQERVGVTNRAPLPHFNGCQRSPNLRGPNDATPMSHIWKC